MHVYLVQHAEATPEEEDPERPLSEKGRKNIQGVAALLGGVTNLDLNIIFHSGKTRARQTAEVLAEYLRPGTVSATDGLNPMADPSIWANRLQAIENDVMLVGHLPHLSKLASLLLCQDEAKTVIAFQMGGTVCFNRDESNIFSVAWMLVPKILQQIRV
jgi:phosphohistidine phosphatase